MPTVKFPKSTTNPIGYVQVTPDNIDKSKKYPLVIFLHGDGGQGQGYDVDLEKLSMGELPKELQVKAHVYNFIVLAPQMSGGWTKEINHVGKMIELAQTLPIDNTKIYLTGISRGGEGVWGWPSWSVDNARKLAALIPVCAVPGRDIGSYCSIGNVPIWAFHAKDDAVVSVQYTINTIAQIEKCIGHKELQATYFETGNHWIWGRVYADEAIYNWMITKTQVAPAPVPIPAFTVSAGVDFTTARPDFKLAAIPKNGSWARSKWTMVKQPEGVSKWEPVIQKGGGWITAEGVFPKPGTYAFEVEVTDSTGRVAADIIEITYNPVSVKIPKVEIPVLGKVVKVYEDFTWELN